MERLSKRLIKAPHKTRAQMQKNINSLFTPILNYITFTYMYVHYNNLKLQKTYLKLQVPTFLKSITYVQHKSNIKSKIDRNHLGNKCVFRRDLNMFVLPEERSVLGSLFHK